MNTSKNRQLAVGILGLAIGALVVDKLVFGGGAAPTFAAEVLLPAGSNATPPATAGAAPAPDTYTVTAQLEQLGEHLDLETGPQLVDAFAPPRALAEVVEAEEARRRLEERRAKSEEQAAKLREQLRLTATVTNGQGRAMINGTLFTLGSEVPGTGFRLKEIDRQSVLLEDTTTQATVRLKLNP